MPAMPTSQSFADGGHRTRGNDELRIRALERLYNRRAIVDELIRSLENYERFPARKGPAECIPIRKW